jgi:hypothetical protein
MSEASDAAFEKAWAKYREVNHYGGDEDVDAARWAWNAGRAYVEPKPETKEDVLRGAGYRYDFVRMAYVNRAARVWFSVEWVRDHDIEELRDKMPETESSAEAYGGWRLIFDGKISTSAADDRIAELESFTPSPPAALAAKHDALRAAGYTFYPTRDVWMHRDQMMVFSAEWVYDTAIMDLLIRISPAGNPTPSASVAASGWRLFGLPGIVKADAESLVAELSSFIAAKAVIKDDDAVPFA